MRMSEHIIQILLLGKIRIMLLWLTSELCGLLRRNIGQRAPRGFVTGPTALTAVTGARGRQARARPVLAAGHRGPAGPAAAADATGTNLGVWAAGRPATRPRVHAKTRWASKACPTASAKPLPAGITSAPPTSLRAPTVHVRALHRVPFPAPRHTRPPPLAASIGEPRAGGRWEGHRSTARGVRAQLGAPPAAAWSLCRPEWPFAAPSLCAWPATLLRQETRRGSSPALWKTVVEAGRCLSHLEVLYLLQNQEPLSNTSHSTDYSQAPTMSQILHW